MKKYGFTLAEVLITLGIIGVVAALTLPSLIQSHKEKETVTRLKRFYSIVSNAYTLAVNEEGTPDNWYDTTNNTRFSKEAANRMLDVMSKYMKVQAKCYQEKGCFADVVYKKTDGTQSFNPNAVTDISSLVLNDGTSVFFSSYGPTPLSFGTGFLSESYGVITVDINGQRNPNQWGYDMFSFYMTKNGIIPSGMTEFTNPSGVFPTGCKRTGVTGWGEACAAWVIYNENMDYFHCDGLSWDGKTKCK